MRGCERTRTTPGHGRARGNSRHLTCLARDHPRARRLHGVKSMSAPVFHALVFWLPAFLFSTTVHEAAHAWVAWRLGDPTAHLAGQVSLSPWPHVRRSPIGMLIIPLITSLTRGW